MIKTTVTDADGKPGGRGDGAVGASNCDRGALDDDGMEVAMESKGSPVEVGRGCKSNELIFVGAITEVACGRTLVLVA